MKKRKLMSLSKQNLLSLKNKIKYIIIASIDGNIFGAFKPNQEQKANNYLEILKKQNPKTEFNIFFVSNLNKFKNEIKNHKNRLVKTI